MSELAQEFVMRCARFVSPYKAALAESPEFLASARRFASDLIQAKLPRDPELVELRVRTKHDRPSSPELERLTRDFFHFDIWAYGAEWGTRLCADVRLNPETGSFVLQNRRDNLDVDDLSMAGGEFAAWFLDSPRCPVCRVFPDVTYEYTGCNLCDYADYQLETIEEARQRFAESVAADLVPAIRALMRAVREEQRPGRLVCLRQRLYEVMDTPAKVNEPLPWSDSFE